ncbi:MAG: secretin and TonB N-terminal domain-containing protein [Candidatus Omnitrophica bacterium]|nr:secretin and TonB N-terminal domain-containing protein [Candidatus Omnitrophota bacterium]
MAGKNQKINFNSAVLYCAFLLIIAGYFAVSDTYLGFAQSEEAAPEVAVELVGESDVPDDPQLVSLNFKDTDIREIINIIAYKGGVNIVAGDDVKVKVNVKLKNVHWEKALDVILKTYNFTYKRDDNLIRVMSLQRALEEEGKIPLVTKIIPLNFADVGKLRESLAKVLSKRGNISIDTRTNALIVTDIPEAVDSVAVAAKNLDARTPQVLIEAMMVDIKITNNDTWGSLLNAVRGSDALTQNLTNLAANQVTWGQGTDPLTGVVTSKDINGVLDFLISQNRAKILANPKVLTLDNQEAKIEITEEIPYLESVDSGSGTTTNVKFKEAGIKLFVTPHVTSGEYISMNVKPEQSFKSGEAQGQPLIDGRKAETNLLVKDGETIVIGGLRQRKDTYSVDKVPFLGDIPLIGLLFKKRTKTEVETELVLFVTPHIVREPILSEHEVALFKELGEKKQLHADERTEVEKFKAMVDKMWEKLQASKIEDKEVMRRKARRKNSAANTEKILQADGAGYAKKEVGEDKINELDDKITRLKETLEQMQDEIAREK